MTVVTVFFFSIERNIENRGYGPRHTANRGGKVVKMQKFKRVGKNPA
jgi:hypothetical protein